MKNPISLKDLPGLLQNGNADDSIVVDMGQIVSRPNWTRRIAFAVSFCLLISAGLFVFNSLSSENIVIVVSSDVNQEVVSDIISSYGGKVTNVSQNTYRVRLSRFKNITSFVEKLSENKQIKKVELQ